MLKVPPHVQLEGAERPVGELVHQLIEDGKAYARAEVGLAKAIAASKASALALPAGLIVASLLLGLAALNALGVGIVLALSKSIGPLGAGLATLALFAALAAGLVWYAIARLKRDL